MVKRYIYTLGYNRPAGRIKIIVSHYTGEAI